MDYETKNKGITLIALIITVVLLIILAGIGIGILINQDGIIEKANEAKIKTEKRDLKEQINIMTIQSVDKYGNLIEETLKAKLEELPGGKEIVDGGNYIGVIYPEYEFYIELESGEISEIKPPTIVDGVIIPNDYTASKISTEDSKLEGLVIYEIPEGATVNWTDNKDTNGKNQSTITIGQVTTNLQETVNQYVWIPVEINDMVMCKSNSGSSICELEYDDSKDILTCIKHSSDDLVGRLYIGLDRDEGYTMNFEKRDQIYDENSYHEPNTINSDVNNITNEQLKSDFIDMAKSVAKNGGFYISRYEVGANGDSKKGQFVLTVASDNGTNYLGADTWYGLYKTIRNIDENKQMIWGCQYDQVIRFLLENGEEAQKGHSYILKTPELSGKNEQDCMRNIYDLEGNYYEWTMESNSKDFRAIRGNGYYAASRGKFDSASFRIYDSPNLPYSYFSSRSTLYL